MHILFPAAYKGWQASHKYNTGRLLVFCFRDKCSYGFFSRACGDNEFQDLFNYALTRPDGIQLRPQGWLIDSDLIVDLVVESALVQVCVRSSDVGNVHLLHFSSTN